MTYYDEGWNARLAGKPYSYLATLNWRDGWKDCNEAIANNESVTEMT